MIVRRWQAPLVPSIEQVKMMFVAEELEPSEELYPAGAEVTDHRHPFDEIRTVVEGELFVSIAGNQLLLRPGDRVEIPSNTKHSTKAHGDEECKCIVARRVFRSY